MSAAALSAGILLRGFRWRVISGMPRSEQSNFSRATNLGVLANMIFPARAGEFVRVFTLVRLSGRTLSAPLASAIIDRLVDLFILLTSASVLYLYLPISDILGSWLTYFFVIGVALVSLIVLYARSHRVGASLVSRFTRRWLKRWPIRPEVFLKEFQAELRRLLGSWLSIELILLALSILLMDYCAVLAMFHAFDLSLPVEVPLLFWVFLAAGSALPSAPGYVGIYQIAAVWSLSFYSVSASTSVAVATTLQIVTLAVALTMVGVKARDLRRLG